MRVELVDSLGTDLTVVNAARVSFRKHSNEMDVSNEKLIKYLAEHGHWTPFGHPQLQFRISAPIFIARQLVKHQVGLVWNEVSRRYVDSKPEIYTPDNWRGRAENKKQGSSEEVAWERCLEYEALMKTVVGAYTRMIEKGICPEQARMILPQSMMTEWYWSGTLMAFARVCNLRCKPDTQLETQWIANEINELAVEVAPVSWKELRK